jgi:hypothetical protein
VEVKLLHLDRGDSIIEPEGESLQATVLNLDETLEQRREKILNVKRQ